MFAKLGIYHWGIPGASPALPTRREFLVIPKIFQLLLSPNTSSSPFPEFPFGFFSLFPSLQQGWGWDCPSSVFPHKALSSPLCDRDPWKRWKSLLRDCSPTFPSPKLLVKLSQVRRQQHPKQHPLVFFPFFFCSSKLCFATFPRESQISPECGGRDSMDSTPSL